MFLLLFRKSVKSIQLALNEFMISLNRSMTVSSSAFTQARRKLSHSAFIELNQECLDMFYRDDDAVIRFKGLRCIAVDCSTVILPSGTEIGK